MVNVQQNQSILPLEVSEYQNKHIWFIKQH